MAFVGEEKLDAVHPVLAYRVRLLLADPALKGQYGVVSGMRTYASQKALYLKWASGRGNLAADPDRSIWTAPSFPYSWKPKGSWHMKQYDGWGHAIDLKRPAWHTRSMAKARVHPLLPKYGLQATVASEWWHVQAITSTGWVDGPWPPELPEGGDEMKQINDTETKRLFTVWTKDGTTTVREHTTYIASAGEPMPNVSYIIDQESAPARANLVKV